MSSFRNTPFPGWTFMDPALLMTLIYQVTFIVSSHFLRISFASNVNLNYRPHISANIEDIDTKLYIYDPCPPSLLSGTLNVTQVPTWRTPLSWHTSNKDINMKLSGYLPWGKKNIIHDVRNNHVLHVSGQEPSKSSGQERPPSPPLFDPPFLKHF